MFHDNRLAFVFIATIILFCVAAYLLAIVAKIGLRTVGFGLLSFSFFLSSLNALQLRGVKPGDLFLAGAAGCIIISRCTDKRATDDLNKFPAALLFSGVLFIAAGMYRWLTPDLSDNFGLGLLRAQAAGDEIGSNMGNLVKFLIASLLLPGLVVLIRPTLNECKFLAFAWAGGPFLSSMLAIADFANVTTISNSVRGISDASGRASGLATQQNHLAVSIVVVTPVFMMLLTGRFWARSIGTVSLMVLFGGVFVSGSRGGLLGLVVVILMVAILVPQLSKVGRSIVGIGLIAVVVVLLASARLLGDLLVRLRFNDDSGRQSDAARALLRSSGIRSFLDNPFFGSGFTQINAAHEVHIQIVASAGLLGAVAYIVYFGTVLKRGSTARKFDPVLGGALCASIIAWMVLGFIENQIADRYLYPPVGVILALAACGKAIKAHGNVCVSPAAQLRPVPVPFR